MKTLIIIGVQKDLCDPSGKVYIKGGEKIIDPIVKLIQENTTIEQIIFVVDWRLPEDASFNSIPEQCIQFTEGAAIPEKLIKACKERGFLTLDGKLGDDEGDVTAKKLYKTYDIFYKNNLPNVEESGAFYLSEDFVDENSVVSFNNTAEDSFTYIKYDNDIIFCGLGLISEAVQNLRDIPELKGTFYVYKPGIVTGEDKELERMLVYKEIYIYDEELSKYF